MIPKYLCVYSDHYIGYGETPETAFKNMLKNSGENIHDIETQFVHFWTTAGLEVVIETKATIKTLATANTV